MVYALDPGFRRDDEGGVVGRERQCAHSDQLRMLRLQPMFEVLLEVGHGVEDGFNFCLAGVE